MSKPNRKKYGYEEAAKERALRKLAARERAQKRWNVSGNHEPLTDERVVAKIRAANCRSRVMPQGYTNRYDINSYHVPGMIAR